PFQISFADGIFALQPMFSYGQRSKCADLLNSYNTVLFILYPVGIASDINLQLCAQLSPSYHITGRMSRDFPASSRAFTP
ncbi:hypothetical protein KHY84_11665, partial [butyrate-producing bacterium]|nr:hypothetical protein [butyrate-producing bacterium]